MMTSKQAHLTSEERHKDVVVVGTAQVNYNNENRKMKRCIMRNTNKTVLVSYLGMNQVDVNLVSSQGIAEVMLSDGYLSVARLKKPKTDKQTGTATAGISLQVVLNSKPIKAEDIPAFIAKLRLIVNEHNGLIEKTVAGNVTKGRTNISLTPSDITVEYLRDYVDKSGVNRYAHYQYTITWDSLINMAMVPVAINDLPLVRLRTSESNYAAVKSLGLDLD